MNPAKLSELIESLEFHSDEHSAWVDLETGRVVRLAHSLLEAVEDDGPDVLEDFPDWEAEEIALARAVVRDSGERFVGGPDRFDFHEYRQMERFIGTLENDKATEELWRAIKGRGAFRHFKDAAHRLGVLEQWYQFRGDALREFVRSWAETNQIPFVDDTGDLRN